MSDTVGAGMVKKKNGLLSVLVELYVEMTIAVFGKFFVKAVIDRCERPLPRIYLAEMNGIASPLGRQGSRQILAG
jgi:hypothetical protein